MNTQILLTGVSACVLAVAGSAVAQELIIDSPFIFRSLDPSSLGGMQGADVAVSGELAVVGRPGMLMPGGSGVVDVFQRTPLPATLEGLPWEWTLLCRLEPGESSDDSRFGTSVAIDGSTVVVGAWSDDTEGINAGAAWVFTIPANPPEVLAPSAQLVPSELNAGDYFGWAVGIDGDIIAVGAWGYDPDEDSDHAGAVWVFERTDDEFVETAKLTSGEQDSAGDRLGSAVEVIQNVVVAGAPARATSAGAVYSYVQHNGSWSSPQRIDAPEGDAYEEFGRSISSGLNDDGSVGGIVVGAPGDGELGPQAGAVWLFDDFESGLFDVSQSTKYTMPGGGPWDRAGSDVTVLVQEHEAGMVVGAPGWRTEDLGIPTGAVFYVPFDSDSHGDGSGDGNGDGQAGRIVIPQQSEPSAGAALGSSVAIVTSSVSGWGYQSVTLLIGIPATTDGLGGALLLDMPTGDNHRDCNGDGRFDPMEVLLLPEEVDCDGNGEHDHCQLSEQTDCNSDSILDACQLTNETDCDGDGALDACQLNGQSDCDNNGVLDVCQIDPATDCNGDNILDVCQVHPSTDCNDDGTLDECQIDGNSDCNGDGELDVCQIHPGADCNADGILDECQTDSSTDCNEDGTLDACQLNPGTDCDGNGVLDECERDGTSDCDGDGLLDDCQINADPMADCDSNGILDVCQLLGDPSFWDCDGNGLFDVCEIMADPSALDCDSNNVLDSCTLAADPNTDCDGDGQLDVCQQFSAPVIPSYWLTEQFMSGVDLTGLGIRLNPTGNSSPPFYQLCTVLAEDVWLDPTGHTVLPLLDDDASLQYLPFPFHFAGEAWAGVYVGSNGNVTFGTSDDSYMQTLAIHFALKRLSVLFVDLDPSAGGQVLYGSSTGPLSPVVVTWAAIPEYQVTGTSNTAQLVLHPDGTIDMSWQAITTPAAITGLSLGTGLEPDFVMTDLSNSFDCVTRGIAPNGDCNDNGVVDVCEAVPAGNPWWGTEHFTGDFDLSNQLVRWQPNGSSVAPRWQVCSEPITAFPVDPTGGTAISMMDDDSFMVPIGFTFPFADQTWTDVHIGSNGYLTFGTADFSWEDSLYMHFQLPRISGLMTDLNPDLAGEIRVQQGPLGSLVVSWIGVPLYGGFQYDVDMQILLHQDGAVEIAWLNVTAFDAVVGISEGTVFPMGFSQTDLSAAGIACEVVRAFDDCDGSGMADDIELALGCLEDNDLNGIPDVCEGGGLIGGMPGPCSRDVTGDGTVDVRDLLEVLLNWGPVKFGSSAARCDFVPAKGDQQVDVADLVEIIAAMQAGCGQPS